MRTTMRCSVLLALLAGGCGGCVDRSRPSPPAVAQRNLPEHEEESPATPAKVRKAAKAGSWYPADRDKLAATVDELFVKAGPAPGVSGPVMALISPHAGYVFSGKAAATAMSLLRGRDVRRIVALAISHHGGFSGASIPEVTHFETPLGLIPLDGRAVARLRRCGAVRAVPEAEADEHSLEIQLPLLQRVLPRFELVPVLIGRLEEKDYGELASALGEVVDARTVVVASSDFTHRGSNYSFEVPDGKGSLQERLGRLDQGAVDEILKLDRQGFLGYVKRTGATICGAQPIALLLELLRRQEGVTGNVVSRYTSGDVLGQWESTVTYVAMSFTGRWPAPAGLGEARSAGEKVFPLSVEEKKLLLKLARRSLDASVRKGSFDRGAAGGALASLQRKAGAFVTLKCKHGAGGACVARGDDLRGCIGTIIPMTAVWDTVAQRAASAALEDPRFDRVSEGELRHITVEVSVLTPPRRVKGPEEIVIGRHGIILSKDGMSATFLPQVAPEQKWDRETTLRHLAQKAGLGADGWRGAEYQVYEAIVFTEGD